MSTEVQKDIRKGILAIEEAISQQEGAFFGDTDKCPLKHHFTDGIYTREIFIPAGMVLTGKIHRHAHPNFLLSGKVQVVTEGGGMEILEGPMFMISPAGTKRALYVLENCRWFTIHLNKSNTRDMSEIEDFVIAPSYEDYERGLKENKFAKFISKIKKRLWIRY